MRSFRIFVVLGITFAGTALVFQNCSGGGSSASDAQSASSSACSPNNVQSCSGSKGAGIQTCSANGSGWGACQLTSCSSGYTLSGGVCVQSYTCSAGSYQFCAVTSANGNSYTCGDYPIGSQMPYILFGFNLTISSVQTDGSFSAEYSAGSLVPVTGSCANGNISFVLPSNGWTFTGSFGLPIYSVGIYSGTETSTGGPLVVTSVTLTATDPGNGMSMSSQGVSYIGYVP